MKELHNASITFFNGDVADQLLHIKKYIEAIDAANAGKPHTGIGVPRILKYFGAFVIPESVENYKDAFAPYTCFDQTTRILEFVTPIMQKVSLESFLQQFGFKSGVKRRPLDVSPQIHRTLCGGNRLFAIIKLWISTTQDPIDFQIDFTQAEGILRLYSSMFDAYSEHVLDEKTIDYKNAVERHSRTKTNIIKSIIARLSDLRK